MEEHIKKAHLPNTRANYITYTHPFVEAYLTKGFMSHQMKWFMKYKKWVTIIPRDSYKYLEFKIYNAEKENGMEWNEGRNGWNGME